MAKVFVSFVHEDAKVAGALQSLVSAELKLGKEVFLSADQSAILAGDSWMDKISVALKDSSVVLLMLSRRSVSRPWVNFEAGAAWFSGKTVIPCCYGNMSKDRMPHPYSTLQGVNLPADCDYLLTSIHKRLDGLGPPPMPRFIRDVTRSNQTDLEKILADAIDPYNRLEAALNEFTDDLSAVIGA